MAAMQPLDKVRDLGRCPASQTGAAGPSVRSPVHPAACVCVALTPF